MQQRDQDIPAGTYPMRVVTRLSGLGAATIRAWERRYGAVVPDRTEGNARRYSAAQVRRLILLRNAVERGHAIGDVATLDDDRLEKLIAKLPTPEAERPPTERAYERFVDDFFAAIGRYDVRKANDILSRAAVMLPARELVMEVFVPIIEELGHRWEAGELRVGQEHLVSSQMVGLLHTLTRLLTPNIEAPSVVVGTPPDHRHELGALIGTFLVASRGFSPIYLGADLPWDDLTHAAKGGDAELILLGLARETTPGETTTLARGVSQLAADCEVWIGCPQDHSITQHETGARLFHGYADLDAALLHRGA